MKKFALLSFLFLVAAGCGSGGTTTKSFCTSSCPTSCTMDNDCKDSGELCCDFGGGSKACTRPQSCPVFCTDDSKCNTSLGQICCQANPASTAKVCVAAGACLKLCSNDSFCTGAGAPKCCSDYSQPLCTATSSCPKQCSMSSECDTASGQSCCPAATVKATLKQYAASLSPNVKGLCGAVTSCPKSCTQSQDCNTAAGQLCCEGLCQTSCQKTCTVDNDCPTDRGQLCCHSNAVNSPWYGWTAPTVAPTCTSGCSRNSDCTGGNICCDYNFNFCSSCSGFCTSDTTCAANGLDSCP